MTASNILKENYINALYRRNNQGKPCVWYISKMPKSDVAIEDYFIIHGIIGTNNKINISYLNTSQKNTDNEIQSKINEKRKKGYKYLNELKDNNELPKFEELLSYLNAYLSNDRTDGNGKLLPMLAKTFDITDKTFNKRTYISQPKINGVRCFISAHRNTNDLFKPISLQFQSREGIIWKTLNYLEEVLLELLPKNVLNDMVEEEYILDGELYVPDLTINMINSAIKNPNIRENKWIQFWCYDLAIENMPQVSRLHYLQRNLYRYDLINDLKSHKENLSKLIMVNTDFHFNNDVDAAIRSRDEYINQGFEGLILREDNGEYQFGKRNATMLKFKRYTDGKFEIVDIHPEGNKRNIALITCKNDINDYTFECHVGGTLDYQEYVLNHKDEFIGKYMFIKYGERSGVNRVPFHITSTTIIK